MSIEDKIEKLTEALEANTAALNKVLAASGPAPKEEPKAAKKKTAKQEAQEAQEEKVADPNPEPETAAAEETEATPTAAELVQKITEVVKNAITAPGADPNAVKTAWRAVCAEFEVEKISGLTDVDKLTEALAKAEAL